MSDCAGSGAAAAASACRWRVTWIRTWVFLLGLNKEAENNGGEEEECSESFVKCVGHVIQGRNWKKKGKIEGIDRV